MRPRANHDAGDVAPAPTRGAMGASAAAELRRAGLRFWSDAEPAIQRLRAGRGFTYRRPDGSRVKDRATLARIRALAIPPAWTDVRIAPSADGHLQAIGRDARGRKQYRYHEAFRVRQETTKYGGLAAFGRALPRIRAQVRKDLARTGLPREKILAAVVRLLELTLVRVGNEEYARLNRSFGLTTLRDRHATVRGASLRFRFRAKSGQQREVALRDRSLARLVSRCQDLPGQELFQYVGEDGVPHAIASQDVNDYLREASGADVTAKMFRTWAATVLAYRALGELVAETDPDAEVPATPGGVGRDGKPTLVARRQIVAAMRSVAERLGNTPTVARQSYVHPAIVETYLEGRLGEGLKRVASATGELTAPTPAEERAVIRLLERSRRRGPRKR